MDQLIICWIVEKSPVWQVSDMAWSIENVNKVAPQLQVIGVFLST